METALDIGRKSNRYNKIASPATITIRKSGSEPYYILHSYMRYTPRQKTRATKIENEQGNCFLYNVRCTL